MPWKNWLKRVLLQGNYLLVVGDGAIFGKNPPHMKAAVIGGKRDARFIGDRL